MRVLAIAPALALVALAACHHDSPLSREAQDAVRAILRDPESARFSEIGSCGLSKIVRGKVNAKTRTGGYNGPVEFIYSSGVAGLSMEGGEEISVDPAADLYLSLLSQCTAAISAQTAKIKEGTRKLREKANAGRTS